MPYQSKDLSDSIPRYIECNLLLDRGSILGMDDYGFGLLDSARVGGLAEVIRCESSFHPLIIQRINSLYY